MTKCLLSKRDGRHPDRGGRCPGYGPSRRRINALAVAAVLGLALVLPAGATEVRNARERPPRLLVLGDSLTAGYNLAQDAAFPVQLEHALKAAGHDVTVLNAGVSGDTTAGGRARLDWVLGEDPDAAIVALGGNDALRGLDPDAMKANLTAIVERFQADGLPVLIAGMKAPPNLGPDYAHDFEAVFPAVADSTGALLHPFFLQGVAADPTLNQADGIHPTARGVAVMVQGILPGVVALLHRVP